MGAQIKAGFGGDNIARGFAALRKLGHEPHGMLRAIGSALVETTQQRFEHGRDPEGMPWKPWSRAYAAVTTSNGILRGRGGAGGLMPSVTYKADAMSVRVGSAKIYAGVHQFGATILPKKGKSLVFHLGKRVVFAKRVTIPARPYLGIGPADRAAVHEIVLAELRDALAKRRA